MALVAALLCATGAVLLYLASPNQQLARKPMRGRILAGLGGIALIGALALLLGVSGPATAIFVWMTLAMLVWSVVPLGVAWWRWREGR